MRHHLVLLSLPRRRKIWLRVEANKEDSSGLVNPIRFPDLGGEENVEESLVVPPLVVPASDGSIGHKGSFEEDDVPVSEDKYGSSVAEKVPVAPISGGESNEIYDIEFNSEIGRSIIQGSDHVLGVCPAPVVNQENPALYTESNILQPEFATDLNCIFLIKPPEIAKTEDVFTTFTAIKSSKITNTDGFSNLGTGNRLQMKTPWKPRQLAQKSL
ncbi:hypothetical protein U1Q18_041671 [Sarracenia purpurea var. burkii]